MQDFKLAAAVASGQLRDKGGAILDSLFKSVMLKINRDVSVRPGSSKFFNSELATELTFLLGRNKCLPEVLRQINR